MLYSSSIIVVVVVVVIVVVQIQDCSMYMVWSVYLLQRKCHITVFVIYYLYSILGEAQKERVVCERY